MLYLASQMIVFLVLAALLGIATGWWLNHLRNQPQPVSLTAKDDLARYETDNDIFTVKRRLDQCFDENARLRRELKSAKERLTQSGNEQASADIQELQGKIQVLLDDLQLRDDTIVALEQELERLRNNT